VADGEFTCRFLQNNRDRREIYAMVRRPSGTVAYGPLALEQVDSALFGDANRPARLGPGDPALAASLAQRAGEFHDLEDFYRFYGYPPDVVEWVESTDLSDTHGLSNSWFQRGGRDIDEVAPRLGVDRATLYRAANHEIVDPTGHDPEGNPLFYPRFWRNWAIGDLSGWRSINPRSHRFKAWLSFNT